MREPTAGAPAVLPLSLSPALAETRVDAETRANHIGQPTATGCLPTITHAPKESAKCVAIIDLVLKNFVVEYRIDNVILAGRWKANNLEAVAATLEWLQKQRTVVTLVGPGPLYDAPVPRLAMVAMRRSDPEVFTRHLDKSMTQIARAMAAAAAAHHVPYLSLMDLVCTRAPRQENGHPCPEIFDQEHLNEEGSKLLALRIAQEWPDAGSLR